MTTEDMIKLGLLVAACIVVAGILIWQAVREDQENEKEVGL